jgi:hypothetical protein
MTTVLLERASGPVRHRHDGAPGVHEMRIEDNYGKGGRKRWNHRQKEQERIESVGNNRAPEPRQGDFGSCARFVTNGRNRMVPDLVGSTSMLSVVRERLV